MNEIPRGYAERAAALEHATSANELTAALQGLPEGPVASSARAFTIFGGVGIKDPAVRRDGLLPEIRARWGTPPRASDHDPAKHRS